MQFVPNIEDRPETNNVRFAHRLKTHALFTFEQTLPRFTVSIWGLPRTNLFCVSPGCITHIQPGFRLSGLGMTPRERKDLPWLLMAFAAVIVMIMGGIIFRLM
jgi:hypothetical protein